MSNNNTQNKKTSIGGSALIEGVMMRGPVTSAMAVRKPSGELDISEWPTDNGKKPWYKKTPFIRGGFNFIDSMKDSYKCLMKSADIAGFEEEPSAFEKKLLKIFGDNFSKVISGFAMVLGALLAVAIFIVLPTFLMGFLRPLVQTRWILSMVETLLKMGIFLAYVILISRMPEIRRVFEYHGAEHKTIACYEAGLDLTVENVRTCSRLHPRCGTSFLFMVMIISILFFSLFSWSNVWVRMLTRLALLPVVAGVSYEINRFAGRHDNWLTNLLRKPGLALQRLTTAEPTDDMMEVAIEAMNRVIPENENEDNW